MTEFQSSFRSIAKRFLKTAVVVDDQAFILPTPRAETAVHRASGFLTTSNHTVNVAADMLREAEEEESPIKAGALVEPEIHAKEALAPRDALPGHDLDAREVVDQFATLGIFCSIVIPAKAGPPPHLHLVTAADIVILDWWNHGDQGDRATEFIKAMAADGGSNRVRVVGIFTGTSAAEDLKAIANAVIDILREAIPGIEPERVDDFTVISGAFRIVIYGKRHGSGVTKGYEPRLRSWREIPEQMVDDFSTSCIGLASGVVLEALSTIREHNWKLLEKFGSALDPAYLWHRGALPEPSDAETHLLAILSAELESLLLDSDCGAAAGLERSSMWLKDNPAAWAQRFGITRAAGYCTDDVIQLLRVGCAQVTPASKALVAGLGVPEKRRKRRPFYWEHPAFCATTATMEDQNVLFAQRSSLKTIYDAPVRTLHLGTILRSGDTPHEPSYWVCLQPLCDSARIDDDRQFPLSPCLAVDGTKPFDIVVSDNGKQIRLAFDLSPYLLQMVTFKASIPGGPVVAKREGVVFRFRSRRKARQATWYHWIAELKPAHAVRLAQQFSDKVGRVGLDESEWLRLSGRS